MESIMFPWSDNWWIEEEKAWFCAGEINALFCVDMNSGRCDFVVRIPEDNFRNFRLYSYCIKRGNMIFCLPNAADCIWCYEMEKEIWEKIDIGNKNQLVISTTVYAQMDRRVWLLEDKVGTIFEVNLEKKAIENEYNLFSNGSEIWGECCILVENELYSVADNKVYCININNAKVRVYELFEAKAGLTTMCYDNHNFWISGFSKEIYVWNPEKGVIRVLTEFPKQFGIYNFNKSVSALVDYDSLYSMEYPIFTMSIPLGKYIWYIPLQSNEILYINKETYKINVLEIEEERETVESLQRAFCSKYIVQYIREERYIGLYSLKRNLIFEIDTVSLCVKNRNYKLSDQAVLAIAQIDGDYDGQRMFRENKEKEQLFFLALLSANNMKRTNFSQNIGEHIFHALNK